MKNIVLTLLISTMGMMSSFAQSVYDFKVDDIAMKEFDMASLKGKRVMIVNTASKCGYTKQYENLQALYTEFKGDNFVIIGFPANDFGKQEPGSNEEIQNFCKLNYGVDFPMMAKISVKGEDIHPLYKFLTTSTNTKVSWNFQKYLIDTDGTIDAMLNSKDKPDNSYVKEWIKTGIYNDGSNEDGD